MKRAILIAFVGISMAGTVGAQKYYFGCEGKLWYDTLNTYFCTSCVFHDKGYLYVDYSGGMSFDPDSNLFVLSNIPEHNIYQVDPADGSTSLWYDGPDLAILMGGFVAMGNGIFYSIPRSGQPSDSLYLWDTNAGTVTSVGKLSFSPIGEMWIAGGELYYMGYALSSSQTEIVKINLSDPSDSESVLSIPPPYQIVALTATSDAGIFLGSDNSFPTADMITVNIIDGTISLVCPIPKQWIGHEVTCITSYYEHGVNEAQNLLDLDCDDSSMATGSDFNGSVLDCFTEGGVAVADTDVIIKMDGLIESMVFQIENPEDGINEIFILSGPTPGIIADGEGTPILTLYSEGAATIEHFKTALKRVRYDNLSLSPTGGMRVIQVYFETESGNGSNIANAFIEVVEHPQVEIDLGPDQELCEGSTLVLDAGGSNWSYEWSTGSTNESITVNEGGTYSVTVSSSTNCPAEDEIEILELPLINISLSGDLEICDGESTVLIITTDAPFDIDVQVTPAPGSPFNFTISESLFEFLDVPSENTEYVITNVIPSEESCINLEDDYQYISVYSVSIDTVELSLCQGDSVLVGNTWYAQTGVYPLMLESIHGCDSIINYNLSVLPAYTIAIQELTCDSSAVGVFNTHINNPDGCDTLITRIVSLQNADTTKVNAFSCKLSETGVTQQLFSNLSGCDSVVISTTIWAPPADTSQQILRSCDSLQFGIYHQMLTGVGGCDSIVRIEVIADEPDTTLLFTTSCNPSDIGVFEETYVTAHSCDSLVIKTVSFSERDSNFVNSSTCDPGSVGIFVSAYTNIYGCDSIVTESISLLPTDETFITSTTCNPSEAGSFTSILSNQYGCDSILNETITLLPSSEIFIESTTCISNEAGVFVSTFVNQHGCDSIITHTVNFLAGASTDILQHTCDSLLTGVVEQTYSGQNGCDSLVTITTELFPLPSLQLISSDYNGFGVSCQGANDGTINIFLDGEALNYLWSNGMTTEALSGVAAGLYTLTVTDINGCSTTASISIAEPEELLVDVSVVQPGCLQQSGHATVFSEGGITPIEYSIDGVNYQASAEFNYLQAGSYTISAIDANGCGDEISFSIEQSSGLQVELGADTTISTGATIQIVGAIDIPQDSISKIQWTGLGPNNCQECLEQFVSPAKTTTYAITAWDKKGCFDSDSITIYVVDEVSNLFIPNVISPNGDQVNDRFIISGSHTDIRILKVSIYDRWGNMVFEANHFQPGDLSNSWDGKMNGKEMDPGVFAYLLIAELKGGGQIVRYGDVTIVR